MARAIICGLVAILVGVPAYSADWCMRPGLGFAAQWGDDGFYRWVGQQYPEFLNNLTYQHIEGEWRIEESEPTAYNDKMSYVAKLATERHWLGEFNHLVWDEGAWAFPSDVNQLLINVFGQFDNGGMPYPRCSNSEQMLPVPAANAADANIYYDRLHERFKEIFDRDAHKIELFSVLNEAEFRRCGPSFAGSYAAFLTQQVLPWVRHYADDAVLYLNSNGLADNVNPVTFNGVTHPKAPEGNQWLASFKQIAAELQGARADTFDLVGIQGHLNKGRVDPAAISDSLDDLYKAIGRPIIITEFDQPGMTDDNFGKSSGPVQSADEEQVVMQNYADFAKVVLTKPYVMGLSFFSVTEPAWIGGAAIFAREQNGFRLKKGGALLLQAMADHFDPDVPACIPTPGANFLAAHGPFAGRNYRAALQTTADHLIYAFSSPYAASYRIEIHAHTSENAATTLRVWEKSGMQAYQEVGEVVVRSGTKNTLTAFLPAGAHLFKLQLKSTPAPTDVTTIDDILVRGQVASTQLSDLP